MVNVWVVLPPRSRFVIHQVTGPKCGLHVCDSYEDTSDYRAAIGILTQACRNNVLWGCLTIRPVARKGYGSIAHEAKPNGLLIRGP